MVIRLFCFHCLTVRKCLLPLHIFCPQSSSNMFHQQKNSASPARVTHILVWKYQNELATRHTYRNRKKPGRERCNINSKLKKKN
jgi:hypothetical protein